MLSGNEPEESVSIPCDWIEELEIENRRITQIPQKKKPLKKKMTT
jgi:hypothetical protein